MEGAEETLQRAESIAIEIEDGALEATVYAAFAKVYQKQGKLDLSKEYQEKARRLFEQDEDSEFDDDEDGDFHGGL